MQSDRCPNCPTCPQVCYIDMSNTASGIFIFIVLVTFLCVGMQLYLYLNIDAATKYALRKFIDCTTSVQSGVQGLSDDVVSLHKRVDLMEHVLLANVTGGFEAVLKRLGKSRL